MFLTLGVLATAEVDDDLFYQMLHALKGALCTMDQDLGTVLGMLRGIAGVVPTLVNDRYRGCLFWLAVALLCSVYSLLYAEAARLLQTTI